MTTQSPVSINRDELTNEQLELVRTRAYELYELRGRETGRDLEDWLQAKQEVLAEFSSKSNKGGRTVSA